MLYERYSIGSFGENLFILRLHVPYGQISQKGGAEMAQRTPVRVEPRPTAAPVTVPERISQRTARLLIFGIPMLLLLATTAILLTILPSEGTEDTPAVQPVQQTDTAPAVVENLPAQAQIEPEVVVPIIPAIELNWVEIGQARNGDEVRALPIPWDRVITDRGTANTPEGTDPIIDFLRHGDYNLPPATNPRRPEPLSEVRSYLLEEDKVIFYGYSDLRSTDEDPFVLSYWKAAIALSEIEGAK